MSPIEIILGIIAIALAYASGYRNAKQRISRKFDLLVPKAYEQLRKTGTADRPVRLLDTLFREGVNHAVDTLRGSIK